MSADARFRPHERLKDPTAFRRAYERKRSAANPCLVLHGVENGLDHARLGISVGKRKVRRAHDRNRIKRVIREAFRLSKAEWPIGVDYVVIPRDPEITFERALATLPGLAKAVGRRLGIKSAQVRSTPPLLAAVPPVKPPATDR